MERDDIELYLAELGAERNQRTWCLAREQFSSLVACPCSRCRESEKSALRIPVECDEQIGCAQREERDSKKGTTSPKERSCRLEREE